MNNDKDKASKFKKKRFKKNYKKVDKWIYRRLVVFGSLIYSFIVLGIVTFKGGDTHINETIINDFMMLDGSIIFAYIFGAVWDDKR